MSHAGKKVLSHGRDLIRPSERGLDRLDRQKGYVAQAERRHNPDKTKNNVNIRKNDRKEANLVMSLYCQFQGLTLWSGPFLKKEGHSDALPVLLPVRYVCQNHHRKEYI